MLADDEHGPAIKLFGVGFKHGPSWSGGAAATQKPDCHKNSGRGRSFFGDRPGTGPVLTARGCFSQPSAISLLPASAPFDLMLTIAQARQVWSSVAGPRATDDLSSKDAWAIDFNHATPSYRVFIG